LPEISSDKFVFEDGYPMMFEERNPASDYVIKKLKEQIPKGKKFTKINWMKLSSLARDINV